MTWQELKESNKLFVTADDVSEGLNCDPQTLRLAVREQKELVGFPCSMIGKTLRIPRPAFIKWVEGE